MPGFPCYAPEPRPPAPLPCAPCSAPADPLYVRVVISGVSSCGCALLFVTGGIDSISSIRGVAPVDNDTFCAAWLSCGVLHDYVPFQHIKAFTGRRRITLPGGLQCCAASGSCNEALDEYGKVYCATRVMLRPIVVNGQAKLVIRQALRMRTGFVTIFNGAAILATGPGNCLDETQTVVVQNSYVQCSQGGLVVSSAHGGTATVTFFRGAGDCVGRQPEVSFLIPETTIHNPCTSEPCRPGDPPNPGDTPAEDCLTEPTIPLVCACLRRLGINPEWCEPFPAPAGPAETHADYPVFDVCDDCDAQVLIDSYRGCGHVQNGMGRPCLPKFQRLVATGVRTGRGCPYSTGDKWAREFWRR
ncbi:hypothetical protein RAS1_14460 [Phycisphaerae bacterium RAS1]|nr:hypothetical protein RAS1_14460 [Phycisphaerae bacterium RAS1]